VPTDEDPSPSGVRSYLGPVVLTSRRRRLNAVLVAAWTSAAVAAVASGRYDIVWLPLVGMATSGVLVLRDRAGRRRSG
jgi:hypothetical protein